MTAVLLTLALFAAWWLIGVAVLLAVRADLTSLRTALTAPVIGTAATVLALFAPSLTGVAMDNCAMLVTVTLFAGSAALVARRRPRLPSGVVPVLVVCVGALILAGWPMFDFGFRWLANANDDMANYVLSAVQLKHHGLLAKLDVASLSHDRGYAGHLQTLHNAGARPGFDIMLAAVATITGRLPYEVFMPLTLALILCGVCGTAALAMQAARRWWAASVAALLVAVSPLATFGAIQQLVPQVWGLALATGLFAMLMRPELHTANGARVRDLVPIAILVTALVLVYVELASVLLLAYGLYVLILASRRQIALRALVRLWVVPIVTAAVVLNTYLARELHFVIAQAHNGVRTTNVELSLFGFTVVPSALPGIVGLHLLGSAPTSHLSALILAAILLLVAVAAISVAGARRGVGASVVLVVFAGLGVLLAVERAEFGLFKLYMYIQPFVAATVAVWLAELRRKPVLVITGLAIAVLLGVQLSTQYAYVEKSRNPGGLPYASASVLLPAFRHFYFEAHVPVVAVTENSTLGKLEAASVDNRPLYFISTPFFQPIPGDGWRARSFSIASAHHDQVDIFSDNAHASKVLASGRCVVVLPTGSQSALNRRPFPEGPAQLVAQSCAENRDLLVFTQSAEGESFFPFTKRSAISFYPPERDFFYPGRTMSGFGRYSLFRILGPSPRVRLELDLTATFRQDRSKRLPPAAVVGSTRVLLPLVGRGSARVLSPPLQPKVIGGQPYLLLDMGTNGRLARPRRHGLQALYGSSIVLDQRYLTSYVRDISLVSAAKSPLHPPRALRSFPADLANGNLEYSGIYEDGWIAEDSYVVLAGGAVADLVIRAGVLPRPGQHLEVLVNGRAAASHSVTPGYLGVRVPLPASRSDRRIELRWAGPTRLPAPDLRPATARLQFLGIVPRQAARRPPPQALVRLPQDLGIPDLVYSGIYGDGWVKKEAHVVLAGGAASDFVLRAEVLRRADGRPQHLEMLVNGRTVASESVAAGQLELRVSIPASRSDRRVELRWAGTARIGSNDFRQAAALLNFLGPRTAPSALRQIPADLANPSLLYSGIYGDGWVKQSAVVVLAGGRATDFVLRAVVLARADGRPQHLQLFVNGQAVASRGVAAGPLELRVSIPSSRGDRRVELRWAGTSRIGSSDPRQAAALLKYIGSS